MSVIAVEIARDGIIVAADGVCYEYETGDVRGFASKLILCPDMECVIGTTGVSDFGRALYLDMGDRFADFDDLAVSFEDFCRQAHHEFMLRNDLYDHPTKRGDASVVIAGWSNRDQTFKGYRIFSYPKKTLNTDTGKTIENQAWTPLPMPDYWASYVPAQEHLIACGVGPEDDIAGGEFAPRWVCAARADSGPKDDGESGVFNAGCFIQMVHLDRSGVRSWIAHRWPEDEIGAPVDPSKGDLMPTWLTEAAEPQNQKTE